MLKTIVGALGLAVLALGPGPVEAAHGQGAPRDPAIFEWSMPADFGAQRDARGRIVETQPYEVRRGPWKVYLRVTGPACAEGAGQRWSAANGWRLRPKRLGPCRFVIRFAEEGTRTIRLDASVDGERLSEAQKVVVRDWLIASLGDSVASGEAVPDVPGLGRATWQSVRCHRSARAAPAVAAAQIERDDGHSSVTFVHLACSGATVPVGLLGPYGGVEPPRDEPPLEPQVFALERIAAVRPVDAVLLSVGANDIHFGDVVRFCARPARDCFDRPLPRSFGGDGVRTAREVVGNSLHDLDRRYDALAGRISRRVPGARVYVVEYFDPTRDARGRTCERILGSVTEPELEQARSRMLAPLNGEIERAAAEHGWTVVDGVAELFREHGYCAGRQAWVTTLSRSLGGLGGTLKGRFLGTLHPNKEGHEATATLISAALERVFYPGRAFPPRPLPEPAADGEGDSQGDGLGDVVLRVLAVLAALLLFVAAVALLLVLSRRISLPWKRAPRAAKPVLSLVKTFRPLFLPLLVVIAVGTVKLSLVVQVLVAAALLVAAWRLIVVPEAGKSEVELSWRRRLLRKVAVHSAVAVALGVLAVLVVRAVGIDNPYFATIGDVASGLLLLALLLWAAALALRLFSYATTRLRSVLAFDIGLALVVLGMAVGILPGNPAVRDAWPALFAVFAGVALALLATDMALSVTADPDDDPSAGAGDPPAGAAGGGPQQPWPLTRRAAGLGFSAALVATVVLGISTAYGLIDAAERGHPLNPPEEESADARVLPPEDTAGEGDLDLARKYAPVLAFSRSERWAPVRVDRYVAEAALSGPPGTPPGVASLDELAALPACPGSAKPACYTLSIRCDSGDDPCAQGSRRVADRFYRDGAVYVRVLDRGDPEPGDATSAFADSGPYRDRLETLIQYWYFYRYNEWRAPVFAGLLIQHHEADWEAVTIGLDAGQRPLFVADSAHCAGSWRPWGEIEASTRLPGPRTHPLIGVAEGSHANYPDPDEKRSPDWASCAGAPSGLTTAISYASNIRDRTEFGWLWYPPADGWIRVDSRTPPMDFPGTWGADDRITLRNFNSNPIGDPGPGPKTPALQALWREPVRTIFCGRYEPKRCTRDGG